MNYPLQKEFCNRFIFYIGKHNNIIRNFCNYYSIKQINLYLCRQNLRTNANKIMKSKFLLWGFAFTLLFTLGSCKSKESAYKAAYEKAKQKEMQESSYEVFVDEVAPVAPTTPNYSVQKERITMIEGTGLNRYSVVVGSFISKTNASSLKERMQNLGYSSILAQNQQDMYRVILSSYENRYDAAAARDALKAKFYPDFQDAWLLEQEY